MLREPCPSRFPSRLADDAGPRRRRTHRTGQGTKRDHYALETIWYSNVPYGRKDVMEQDHTIWSVGSPRALGAALRAFRLEEGLTQQQLAVALGTTRHRLSRIEDGKPSDQVLLLMDMLRHLGVTMQLGRFDA